MRTGKDGKPQTKGRGKKKAKGVGSADCFECKKSFPRDKLRLHTYLSLRPNHPGYKHPVCKLCHQQLVRKDEKEGRLQPRIEPETEVEEVGFITTTVPNLAPPPEPTPPKPEPEPELLPTTPIPQILKSDKRPQGYIHPSGKKIKRDEVPIHLQEKGTLTINTDRLDTMTQQLLGKAVMKMISKQAGHRCVQVNIKSLKVDYIVKHPRRNLDGSNS